MREIFVIGRGQALYSLQESRPTLQELAEFSSIVGKKVACIGVCVLNQYCCFKLDRLEKSGEGFVMTFRKSGLEKFLFAMFTDGWNAYASRSLATIHYYWATPQKLRSCWKRQTRSKHVVCGYQLGAGLYYLLNCTTVIFTYQNLKSFALDCFANGWKAYESQNLCCN